MMTEQEAEARHEKLCAFQRDFALLVRRYVPTPAAQGTRRDDDFLAMMQDSTSCFTPYVWGEEFDNLAPMPELPDDGELESWRTAATKLLSDRGTVRGSDIRTAAHKLENAYLFVLQLKAALEEKT